MLIVFEGIDGTGKSTQLRMLAERLEQEGYEVVSSFEPTNGQYGSLLRSSASRPEGRYSLQEEFDLFLLDRRDHIQSLITPALQQGKIVLLDRYYFSTMAYQGARGMDPAHIRAKNEEFAIPPDLVLVLTQPVEVSLERIGGRDGEGDAFEARESLEKCAEIFLSLEDEAVHFIDAQRTADLVHEQIHELVLGYMA